VPSRPAPDFNLVDQNGQATSLTSLEGRAVVLEPGTVVPAKERSQGAEVEVEEDL
jgi:hypothetical protein